MWSKSDSTSWQLTLSQQPFLNDCYAARQVIAASNGKRWLLYNDDRYTFAVWLLALLAEHRNPVLPQNAQPETLALLADHIDATTPATLPVATTPSPTQIVSGKLTTPITLFTSGSSGQPQAIYKTIAQLLNEVRTLEQAFGPHLGDAEVLSSVTHQHIYGLLFTVLWPLCCGRNFTSSPVNYLEQWHAFHHRQRPYYFVSSPAHLQRYDELQPLANENAHLRYVFSSGGPLAASVPEHFIAAELAPPVEVYGSTETGGIAWRQRHAQQTAFTRFAGVEVAISAEQRLSVRSAHLPDHNWFMTEDRVQALDSQHFELLGRMDRIVKIAEKRVSLTELEQFCETHAWVAQAKTCILHEPRNALAMVLVLTEQGQQQLRESGRGVLRKALREHLQRRFEKVVLPRKYRYVTHYPLNAAGKVTQTALQQLFIENAAL